MGRQLVASVRAGESVTRTAERLLDVDNPRVELPAHVRALRDAARFELEEGDENLYESAIGRWRSRIERLGEQFPGGEVRAGTFSIRSATQQLAKDLARARPDQVQHLIDRWVLERARHQARVVARTETVEAFRDAYRAGTEDQPYVRGYRWVLSNRHPRPDVCDILAHQDLHGLGPGGYPVDELPPTPHPLDLCSQVAIVDTHHFRRELARARGEAEPPREWEGSGQKTAEDWLREQTEGFRQELLGPTRSRVFAAGGRVLDNRGVPLPVHAVLGQPQPARRRSTGVQARPLVEADRARMVRPFRSI